MGGHGRRFGDGALIAIEEQEEQREAFQCGELEMAEERQWEGNAAPDEELAAMEEEGLERRLEESQGGEGDAEGGAGTERESKMKWVEVWASDVCLLLGCKCENGLPEAGSTSEVEGRRELME